MRHTSLAVCAVLIALTAAAAPPSAVVTTIAGTPAVAGYADGPAQNALFTHPTWLDVAVNFDRPTCVQGATGEIYVVDRINQLVRRITVDGKVSTVPLRIGTPQLQPKPIQFGSAFGGGILVEPPGSGCGCGIYARGMFVSSSGSDQVVLFAMDGLLASRDQTVMIGNGQPGSADVKAQAETAQLHTPMGLARSWNYDQVDAYGRSLYIADSANHAVRRVGFILSLEACPIAWNVTTLAGLPGAAGSADGKGSDARFNTPRGIAAAPDGSVYVSDAGNDTIRKIAPDGTVTTVAGEPGVPGSNDGPALQAHLNTPSGIDVNEKGEVFIVDTFNHTIRKLTTDGMLVTIAGQPGVSGFADGANALFNAPVGLKVAPDGSLVVADTGNNVIRRVTLP